MHLLVYHMRDGLVMHLKIRNTEYTEYNENPSGRYKRCPSFYKSIYA
jgi:hypothetical protein